MSARTTQNWALDAKYVRKHQMVPSKLPYIYNDASVKSLSRFQMPLMCEPGRRGGDARGYGGPYADEDAPMYRQCGQGVVGGCPRYKKAYVHGEDMAVYAIHEGTLHDPNFDRGCVWPITTGQLGCCSPYDGLEQPFDGSRLAPGSGTYGHGTHVQKAYGAFY